MPIKKRIIVTGKWPRYHQDVNYVCGDSNDRRHMVEVSRSLINNVMLLSWICLHLCVHLCNSHNLCIFLHSSYTQ